jgi:LAO/AO transport system kinase
VVLCLVPGYGDAMQAMKAGILEIADVVVVNKADLPEAGQAAAQLRAQGLSRRPAGADEAWTVPVLEVAALRREGLEALVSALDEHDRFTASTGARRATEAARRNRQFLERVAERVRAHVLRRLADSGDAWTSGPLGPDVDPYTAAEAFADKLTHDLEMSAIR